jgi:hypothetical protein
MGSGSAASLEEGRRGRGGTSREGEAMAPGWGRAPRSHERAPTEGKLRATEEEWSREGARQGDGEGHTMG